jgi:hypothetical protein
VVGRETLRFAYFFLQNLYSTTPTAGTAFKYCVSRTTASSDFAVSTAHDRAPLSQWV